MPNTSLTRTRCVIPGGILQVLLHALIFSQIYFEEA